MFWKKRYDGWELSLAIRTAVVLKWGTRRGLLELPQCPFYAAPRMVGRKSLGEHFKKTRDCWDRLCVSFVEYVGEIVLEDGERDAGREDALIRGVVDRHERPRARLGSDFWIYLWEERLRGGS